MLEGDLSPNVRKNSPGSLAALALNMPTDFLFKNFVSSKEKLFDVNNANHKSINQLKGLQKYAPIDYSFEATEKSPIRLAVLTPFQQADNIIRHLNNLHTRHAAKSNEMFLPNYGGFYETYKRALNIPSQNDSQLFRTYDESVNRIALACETTTRYVYKVIKEHVEDKNKKIK